MSLQSGVVHQHYLDLYVLFIAVEMIVIDVGTK